MVAKATKAETKLSLAKLMAGAESDGLAVEEAEPPVEPLSAGVAGGVLVVAGDVEGVVVPVLALHCDTSALAPQALGRTRAFSLVRLSDLSISTLLNTEQRQVTSVSTISFNGIQHDAGGGGVAE